MSNSLLIGIDASNLRAGGGLTHIVELLSVNLSPEFSNVRYVVWSSRDTLSLIPNLPHITKISHTLLNNGLDCK